MHGRSQISFHEMELFSGSFAADKIHRFSTDQFISANSPDKKASRSIADLNRFR
jgi:hypothetical protein